jgi:hypothetical protein
MADALDGQQASLRHALAIAIVRNKRRCVQEAAEWRAKAQKLENDLQDQQAKQAQLQQWVANVLQQQQKESSMPEPLEQTQVGHAQLLPAGIFLPPLSCDSWISDQQQPAVNLHALRKQVALAAAAAGDGYSSVAALMEGKAAALSHILLTNVQMLQQLAAQPSTGSTGGSSGSSAQGHASECVSGIGTFITSTLLQAPKSSLSSAYMKQSATVLAAVLAPPASNAIGPAAAAAGATGCSQHSQHGQLGPDSPEALAVQVVQLMQQLLQLRAAGAANNLDAETGANSSSAAVGAAATVTLQQLSTFPSTALLLCLAAAQHMQQCVQELQEANAVVTRTSPSSFCMCAGAAEQALLVASQAFQAAHELLLDLVSTSCTPGQEAADKTY